jgi:hypothetical protein
MPLFVCSLHMPAWLHSCSVTIAPFTTHALRCGQGLQQHTSAQPHYRQCLNMRDDLEPYDRESNTWAVGATGSVTVT